MSSPPQWFFFKFLHCRHRAVNISNWPQHSIKTQRVRGALKRLETQSRRFKRKTNFSCHKDVSIWSVIRTSKWPAELSGIEKTFLKCWDQNYVIQRLCLHASMHIPPHIQGKMERKLVEHVIWRPGFPEQWSTSDLIRSQRDPCIVLLLCARFICCQAADVCSYHWWTAHLEQSALQRLSSLILSTKSLTLLCLGRLRHCPGSLSQ